jgi:predicted Zn-dependent peptidase
VVVNLGAESDEPFGKCGIPFPIPRVERREGVELPPFAGSARDEPHTVVKCDPAERPMIPAFAERREQLDDGRLAFADRRDVEARAEGLLRFRGGVRAAGHVKDVETRRRGPHGHELASGFREVRRIEGPAGDRAPVASARRSERRHHRVAIRREHYLRVGRPCVHIEGGRHDVQRGNASTPMVHDEDGRAHGGGDIPHSSPPSLRSLPPASRSSGGTGISAATMPGVKRGALSSLAIGGLLFVGTALLGCDAEPYDTPPVTLDVPIEQATLKNGLSLCVVPNRAAPLVTALVAVRAGAFTEDTSVNGYSHLFEHMIFQGSEATPDPTEFRLKLEALGVRSNATTGIDEVDYYFTASTAALDDATSLFAGALEAPALSDAELEREKQVVLGEFDLDEADDDFVRHRRMLEELFGDYVSRVEPLGSRQVVMQTTSEQLHAAHDTYYVPNNALFVLSGDIDMKHARSLAENAFGAWPRGADPFAGAPTPSPKPLARSRYAVLEAPISDTRIEIGFMCPGAEEDEGAVLAGELLSRVTYRTDHRFRRLVGSQKATSAGLDYVGNRHASYVTVDIVVPQGLEVEVLALARDALDHLGEPGDVTAAQLGEAKDDLWSSYFYTADDPSRVAHAIAARWGHADAAGYASELDDVYATDLAALDRLASKCVRGRPRAVVLQSSREWIDSADIDAAYLESKL